MTEHAQPCTPEQLAEAERRLDVSLPSPVRTLYEEADGRFQPDGEWWVVWPLARLVEENRDGWQRGLSRTLLAFGDDGIGDAFCTCVDHPVDEVVRWSWIDSAIESTEGTFSDFVAEWVAT